MGIPTSQKAAVKQGTGSSSTTPLTSVSVPTPGPGQILVKINWTGLCHSDIGFLHDYWPEGPIPVLVREKAQGICGHEGAGTVVAVADDAKELWSVGDRAGIKWCAAVCHRCEFCLNGRDELHCASQLNSGLTTPGTFQRYVATDARYATRLPDKVSDEQAGPLMCGGVTAYVACKRSEVKPGQWIVMLGAGGGLGHLGLQYAKAMGMRSIAFDVGSEKEELCKQMGAEEYVDASTCEDFAAKVMEITTYGAHGVIVFAPTRACYEAAPYMLRPGGTMVAVGFPKDPTIMAGAPPQIVAMRKLNIVGSVTGTLKEVEETLDFTVRGLVHPILVKGKLSELDKYIDLVAKGKLLGRAVLEVED